jgi:hypothetical protein
MLLTRRQPKSLDPIVATRWSRSCATLPGVLATPSYKAGGVHPGPSTIRLRPPTFLCANLPHMAYDTSVCTNVRSLLPADRILVWFGNQVTKHSGRELGRGVNESFYSYFSRWLAIKGMRLEWDVERFAGVRAEKQTVCRPVGKPLVRTLPTQ